MEMVLTFRHGRDAITAVKYDNTEVNGHMVRVKLQTPDWKHEIDQEMRIIRSNTTALVNLNSSLLAEDRNIPSMSFDLGGKIEENTIFTVCLFIHNSLEVDTNS